jgi:hypothetical protein
LGAARLGRFQFLLSPIPEARKLGVTAMNASRFRRNPGQTIGVARSLFAMVAAFGILQNAVADDSTTDQTPDPGASSPSIKDVANTPPENLEPVTVNGSKLPGILGKLFGYSWNVSEDWGNNFHIRRRAAGGRHWIPA